MRVSQGFGKLEAEIRGASIYLNPENIIRASINIVWLRKVFGLGINDIYIYIPKYKVSLPIPSNLVRGVEKVIVEFQDDKVCAYLNTVKLCVDSSGRITSIMEPYVCRGKECGLTGPFMDVFNSKTIILPCDVDDRCKKSALSLQYWWNDYALGTLRIMNYSEVISEKLYEKYNIVVIGGDKINKYLERIAQYIKIVKFLEDGGVVIRNKEYIGPRIGIAMIYPNPDNPKRYIAILGSNSLEAVEAIYRIDPVIVPDYLVYDAMYIGYRPEGVIDSGFFNYDWG